MTTTTQRDQIVVEIDSMTGNERRLANMDAVRAGDPAAGERFTPEEAHAEVHLRRRIITSRYRYEIRRVEDA